MKAPILSLFSFLALCILQASTFGLYGCYEQIMYWEAYKLDAGTDKDKQMVAKSCASNSDVQDAGLGKIEKGRCNFRQFLYYISDSPEEREKVKNLPANVENQKSVDALADKLHKNGNGGAYHTGRIYEGVAEGNISDLFKAVAGFIGVKNSEGSNRVRWAMTARKRVQEGRVAVRNRDVGYLLRWDFDREHQPKHFNPREQKTPRQLPLVTEGLVPESENGGRGWETVDLKAAKDRILADPKHKGKVIKIQKYIDEIDTIQAKGRKPKDALARGHKANIESITKAKRTMSGAGCSK